MAVEVICVENALFPCISPKRSDKPAWFSSCHSDHQQKAHGPFVQVAESAWNFNSTILLATLLQVFLLENSYILLRIIVLPGNGK